MAERTDRDYDHLCSLLRAVSLRRQLLGCVEALIVLASGLLLLLLASLALPVLSPLSRYLPLVYWVVTMVFVGCLLWRGLRAVWPRLSLPETARGLERAYPVLRDDVTNSILLFKEAGSEAVGGRSSIALIRAQLKKTLQKTATIRPSDAVKLDGVLRRLLFLAPLAFAMAMVLVIDSAMVGRALALLSHPLSTVTTTSVSITLGQKSQVVVARGDAVNLRFIVAGHEPDRLLVSVWPEGAAHSRSPASRESGSAYAHRIESAIVSFRYQAATGRGELSPIGVVHVVDPPDLESLRLTLTPPSYTGLRPSAQDTGHITALGGTQVNLAVEATKEVVEGEIVMNEQNRYSLTIQGQRLSGGLLVLEPGTYRIAVKDEFGFANREQVTYEIRVVPDRFPEVQISQPAADMEITGDEMLAVVYRAADDFGVNAVRLVYQLRGEERRITLKNEASARPGERLASFGPQKFDWDLSALGLLPGEGVSFRIEAEDNDAISGPKSSSSRTISLSMKDERGRAAREGADSQRLADALLGLLADQLEEKSRPEALVKGMEQVLEDVAKGIEKAADRPDRFDLEALQRNLTSLKERAVREPKERVTQELERLALLADDLAKGARMNEVEAMAREMRNRQRQLVDALRDFKGPPTREGLGKIAAQLKKLEELLRQVMDALGRLATRLPDEFINSQELSGLELQDMFGELSEMYRKLAEGDVAGALEAARKMLQNIQEMMASLGRAGSRAGSSPSDRMEAEMAKEASELDKILAEEREIFSGTEEINSGMKSAAESVEQRRLEAARPALDETMESLRRALPEEQGDMVAALKRLFESGRLDRVEALLEQLENQMTGAGAPEQHVRRLRELSKGLRAERHVPDDSGREGLSSLSDRQERVKGRTDDFLERLEALAQLFPGMDTSVLKDIEGAAESMGNAAGRLKKVDPAGALPPEEDAIRRLSKSQQAMQQMSQQMAQQAGARMQAANRWGYMVAYDPRPGWYYGPWMPMPTLPQPEVRYPREKGRTGIDREEFEPPSKDAYRVPARFRERIMESMKQPVPRGYERDVEHYFRGLAQ